MPALESDVVAVDGGSRSLRAIAAANKVSELIRQLASCRILYKTVDSTLRGHVMAELEAAYKQSGRKSVVFAPAFPAAGRTTVNGVQLVGGVPVANTVYGSDPVHPAQTSVLAELLPASVRDISIFDATTQEELDTQVAAVPDPEEVLWVGSPGMAQALAQRIEPEGRRARADPTINVVEVLVAVGSANPLSHQQASRLKEASHVVLLTAPTDERLEEPRAVIDEIAQDAVAHLESGKFGALIAVGGDTMEAILDRLKIRQFEVLRELETGFPLGRAELLDGSPLLIAMKAGGFGDDATLINAVVRLTQAHPAPKRKAV